MYRVLNAFSEPYTMTLSNKLKNEMTKQLVLSTNILLKQCVERMQQKEIILTSVWYIVVYLVHAFKKHLVKEKVTEALVDIAMTGMFLCVFSLWQCCQPYYK